MRRASTWITRRISSSRPTTGSSLPWRASAGEVASVLGERLVFVLGIHVGDALTAAHLGERLEQRLGRDAGARQSALGVGCGLGAGERDQ